MENNKGYIICVKTISLGECYLGHYDGVVSKLHSAIIYHDDIYVKSDLDRIIKKYKNTENSFFYNPKNLSIKKIEINIVEFEDE